MKPKKQESSFSAACLSVDTRLSHMLLPSALFLSLRALPYSLQFEHVGLSHATAVGFARALDLDLYEGAS